MDTAQEPKEELRNLLNQTFDSQRQRLGLTNDMDFARYLGVSPKTLSFWRNGRWQGADAALITAIFEGRTAA